MTQSEIKKFRMCREWRDRVRPLQLLDFPVCQICEKNDKIVEAVQVDHIIPLEQGGEPFERTNLQSLCFRCHVIKSAEENRARLRKKNNK